MTTTRTCHSESAFVDCLLPMLRVLMIALVVITAAGHTASFGEPPPPNPPVPESPPNDNSGCNDDDDDPPTPPGDEGTPSETESDAPEDGDPVIVSTGEFIKRVSDIRNDVDGMLFPVHRRYGNQGTANSGFGQKWDSSECH